MRSKLAALVLLGVALAWGEVAVGGDAKADLKKFEGTWAVEFLRRTGKDAPAEVIGQLTFTFAGGKVTSRSGDKQTQEGTYKIDPSKKPRHIDLTLNGKMSAGIYAFEGDRLKLCLHHPKDRPTEFSAPAGSTSVLLVLKRAKQ
jgi:uncharacterized protein (TIGR03067 family)